MMGTYRLKEVEAVTKPKKPAKQNTKAEAPAKLDAKKDAQLKARLERIKAREGDRGKGPRLEIEPGEDGVIKSKMPDNDLENALSFFDLAGTANPVFAEHLMGQMIDYATCLKQNPDAKEKAANALLGAVHGMAPNDEAEAMLICQMAACQGYAMELMTRAAHTGTLLVAESVVNMANKLMRTYTSQMQTLARYRGKTSQQKVIVEHVNVEAGGQAVVGAVQAGGRGDSR